MHNSFSLQDIVAVDEHTDTRITPKTIELGSRVRLGNFIY